MNSKDALQKLIEGNKAYVSSNNDNISTPNPNHETILEQKPFAIILGCSDSRVPAEIVFRQGLGDLFVIRIAGNIVAPSQVGSIEFACQQFGTPLVVVLGHTHCGAIKATVDSLINDSDEFSPNLASIVDLVTPAVLPLVEGKEGIVADDHLCHTAMRANVEQSVKTLKTCSRSIRRLIKSGDLEIVGAEYSIETGEVEFYQD